MYGACTDMRANIHTHKTIRFKSAFGPRSRGTPVVLELINQKQEDHEFKSKVVWALGSGLCSETASKSMKQTKNWGIGFLLLEVRE